MGDNGKGNRSHAEEECADEIPGQLSDGSRDQSQEVGRLRRKYNALLEGAPDAIFVADAASGEIVEANRSAAVLLETTVDEVVGRHQSELHPREEAEQYRSFFQKHQRAAGSNSGATFSKLEDGSQICVVTDTGKTVPVEINASFVELDDEALFVGIFRDITERLHREEKLREAKEAAEEASELKSAVLRNVSHEIRTPITSIIGFSKILADSLDDPLREHADRIHRASQRLMKTIDSVLDLSTLEADVHELERETARLCRAVRWAAELLGAQAEEKDVALQRELPEGVVEGYWNQEALNQIAEELLENAIKFTPPGGTVAVRVWETEADAVLEVEDTGIGMEPEEVEKLFEPFKQASDGLTREYAGVGLGLAIVKELTEALGGTVEVQTENGEGSCFTVRLPRRIDDAPEE
jgi:PAS domain S-box-containing protein